METVFKIFLVLGFLAVIVGLSALMGWLTMTVLAAFGIHVSFWIAWGIYTLLGVIFGRR